jgi:D-tyrosyl-tRNA(Tyr) deacylase
MRAVIQRVDRASVTVDNQVIGSISRGMVVLLGIEKDDGAPDLELLRKKILNLRIFNDSDGRLNLSIQDIAGEILLVSQFTLYGDCRKGNRPSFSKAAPPNQARDLYLEALASLRTSGLRVEAGEFQAMMKVSLVNDGPVTLIFDTKVKRERRQAENGKQD